MKNIGIAFIITLLFLIIIYFKYKYNMFLIDLFW